MALMTGPRQVGKTTTCRSHADVYANWDNVDDREQILAGPARLAERFVLDRLSETTPVALFDELHKYPRWKPFLKGFFDTYADQLRILVTGSSRMDVDRRGGDSLMGRYSLYRMHPFSVAETLHQDIPDPRRIVRLPREIKAVDFDALWRHGGYPEPFLKRDDRFSRRWQSLRLEQLVREDIRDLTQIQQLDQLESLVRLLTSRSAHQLVYGTFELGYLRDKERREVDFVVARDGEPWFLAEVKQQDESISGALKYYQEQLKAPFAFQVVFDIDYVSADCFAKPRAPLLVPAKTFLSQLL